MSRCQGSTALESSALAPDRAPLVVFVTAWEEHALRAFEVNAVDYLLKPYPPQRVREACRRLLERSWTGGVDEERDRLGALEARLNGRR